MKIALVDDNKEELVKLSKYISTEIGNNSTISVYHSGEEFLTHWFSGAFDLVILDIFMNQLLGIDVAKTIRQTDKEVRLAFCTSSNEFASESYEVNAHYYLRKPITKERVLAMLDRINLEELEHSRYITFFNGQKVILRNIIAAEYAGHNVTFHNKHGNDITIRVPLTEVEALLKQYPYFCCCSKGVIINFYEVESLKENTFCMKDKTKEPISRRKFKEVSDAYAAFRFNLLRQGSDL